MSWFRQKGAAKPDYTGLQLQTSVNTLPIPIVWGQTKIAANVVWYSNFQTQGGGGGKGGLFGGSPGAYNYTADLILALCEGPIATIGVIWKDQATYTLAGLGLTFFNGSTPQAVWGYLSSTNTAQAIAYQGTAYVCAAGYQLGGSANIGNHNFEIVGVLAGTGVNGVDADPALVIEDFLTNPQYGVGLSPASLNATSLFGSGGDASLQTYCKAMGLAFSPALVTQEQSSSILSRWLQTLNCAAIWSGGQLKFIPYGDVAIPSGPVSRTIQVVAPTPVTVSSGLTPPPSVRVCAEANFVSDQGVVYSSDGAPLTYIGASAPTAPGTYGISPPGVYLFAIGDEGKALTIAYTYSVPVSYNPNLMPIYNLTDLDFVDDRGGKDPVQVSRVDPFSLATIQRIECLSRSNQYGGTPVEARDQSQIELYGPRVGSTLQAHEICDEINIGPLVAQTFLQRQLYVRSEYAFKLSWEYGLLEPMDIVTISDANLGLSNFPVRIISVEEDDRGLLTIKAEELTVGVSAPALYPNSGPVGYLPNQGIGVAPVNAPLIYEPPPALTGGVAQIWVGASGGAGGNVDTNWGGAYVWISLDNTTYSQVATISQPLRQGSLTAALPLATGWDPVNALAISLSQSGGALSGTSEAGAQNGSTLSLVESELFAYQSATLSAVRAYTLSGLQRGLDSSPPAAHPIGAPFARMDSAVVKYALPLSYIGQTLFFKFQSFNIFGSGVQSLAACVAYPYVPTGAGALGPVASSLAAGASLDYGLVANGAAEMDDFGTLASPYVSVIDLGNLTS